MSDNLDELDKPKRDGVFGPELLLSAKTGDMAVQAAGNTTADGAQGGPWVNAFLVWVGVAVVVVSEGVEHSSADVVSTALRAALVRPDLAVVFALGGRKPGYSQATVSQGTVHTGARELARAEAFANVQCGLEEAKTVTVSQDGEQFAFALSFVEDTDGNFVPTLRST